MKTSAGLPLLVSLFLLISCGDHRPVREGTSTDTVTRTPSDGGAGMTTDDTVRRSDAVQPAKDSSGTKPIGTPEEKTKNLK